MNQNNRCNMNNSIFYKQKLDCSVSLTGKANMPKINFPESLINVLRSALTGCYKKQNVDDLYPRRVTNPNPHFPDRPGINNYNHFPWLYSSCSRRSQVQVIHTSVISCSIFTFLLFLLAGLLTAWVTNYHLKHQTGTKLSQWSLHKAGITPCLLGPKYLRLQTGNDFVLPISWYEEPEFLGWRNLSSRKALWACTNLSVTATDKPQFISQCTM